MKNLEETALRTNNKGNIMNDKMGNKKVEEIEMKGEKSNKQIPNTQYRQEKKQLMEMERRGNEARSK